MARKAKVVEAEAEVKTKAPRKRAAKAVVANDQEGLVAASAGETTDDTSSGQVEVSTDRSEAGEGSSVTQDAGTATDAAERTSTRSVIDRDRYRYTIHNDIKTSSGRAAVDNNDAIASSLRGLTLEQVAETLVASGGTIKSEWAARNPGMQRMIMGNIIRRIYNEGKPVTLPDGSVLEGEAKAKPEPKPRVRKEKPEPVAAKATDDGDAANEPAAEAVEPVSEDEEVRVQPD